mmetsp:Transcript_31770/g.57512  ORF Transcript_31770/g.57512 Transcript_31770/m.57512 type:complete len:106 (-) Transcript_31770:231-548(-)
MDSWSAKARAFGPYKRQQSLESVRLHHFHILIFPPLSSLCGWVRFIVFAAAIILTTCSLSDFALLNICCLDYSAQRLCWATSAQERRSWMVLDHTVATKLMEHSE